MLYRYPQHKNTARNAGLKNSLKRTRMGYFFKTYPCLLLLLTAIIGMMVWLISVKQSSNESGRASRMNRLLCKQDSDVIRFLSTTSANDVVTAEMFFGSVMYPIQSACTNMKRIGGFWYHFGYDGAKYVCLDDLLNTNEECLIYSFGIGPEVSFEHAMMQYGCRIHSYDHSISEQTKASMERPESNFFIHLLRMSDMEDTVANMTTFERELAKYGHSQSTITYLKVDIEGGELDLVPLWLKSGVLNQVRQIGFEFHGLDDGDNMARYFRITRDLYKSGFKIISFDPNYATGTVNGFMTYFEIVFRKVVTSCQFEEDR